MGDLPKCNGCRRKFTPLPSNGSDHTPLLLRCSHTLCKRCVSKSVAAKGAVTCPACSVKTESADGNDITAELWPNIYYAGTMACGSAVPTLAKYFSHTRHNTTNIEPTRKKIPKTYCSECVNSVATCRCCQCFADMCAKCFKSIHGHSEMYRQHRKVALRPSLTETECAEHNRLLEYYCDHDKTPVCPDCVISPQHKGHEIVRISVKYDNHREKIMDAMSKAESSFLLSSNVKLRLEKQMKEIKTDAHEQSKAIHSLFLNIMSKLQVDYIGVLKALTQCMEFSCDEIMMHLEEIEEKEQRIKDACSDASLILSKDAHMQVVLDPEELVSNLESYTRLPYDLYKKLEFSSNETVPSTAIQTGYFKFSANPDMLSLFSKFGEIEIVKGYSFELGTIGDNIGILEGIPRPKIAQEDVKPAKIPVAIKEIEPSSKSQELVTITYVDSPSNFNVQRVVDQANIKKVERFLNRTGLEPSNFKSISAGELCAANYDKTGMWYRARVIGKVEETTKNDSNSSKSSISNKSGESHFEAKIRTNDVVEVCFVDYGNTVMTKVKCLRRLPPEWKALPALSIPCTLDSVCAVDGNKWNVGAKQYFAKAVDGRRLLMTTVNRDQGVRLVEIFLPGSDTIDDDVSVSISDALVFLGFAKHRFPPAQQEIDDRPKKKFLTQTSLPKNSVSGVTICYIESPDRFFVQKADDSVSYLEGMDQNIQYWVKKQTSGKKAAAFSDFVHDLQIVCPKVGMICLACFPANRFWYRAEVISVNEDRTVDVEYVDYGNKSTIHVSGLFKIPEMFTRLPVQALRCRLCQVKPPADEEKFTLACVQRFAELCTTSDVMIMDVRDVVDQTYCVDLYDESPGCISVSNHLYREGLVTKETDLDLESAAVQIKDAPSADEASVRDSKTKARITHVESPAFFCLQTQSAGARLNEMMRELQMEMDKEHSPEIGVWKVGDICAAKSKREKRWCRGRIKSIKETGDVYSVNAIDFGWDETLLSTSLRRLPERFIDDDTQYLLRCCLGGVSPAGGTGKWTSTASNYFIDLTSGEECLIEVLETPDDPDGCSVVELWTDLLRNECALQSEELPAVSKDLIIQGLALPVRRPLNAKTPIVVTNGLHTEVVEKTADSTPISMPEQALHDYQYENEDIVAIPITDEPDSGHNDDIASPCVPATEDLKPAHDTDDSNCRGSLMQYIPLPVVSVGKTMRCSVYHVHDQDYFYVRRHAEMNGLEGDTTLVDDSFDWKMAMTAVQERDKAVIPAHDLREMMPCLCMYDTDQHWHRAIVLSVGLQYTALVQYVDFGTLEEVPVDRLRYMPESLMRLPTQALLCTFADEEKLDVARRDGAFERFCEAVHGTYLEAVVDGWEEPAADFAHYGRVYVVSLRSAGGAKLQFNL